MSTPSGSLSQEINELRHNLEYFKPGDASKSPNRIDFPENFYIGVFGKTGCGKTSLINSIKYAAIGRLQRNNWIQVAPQDKAGGQTMFLQLVNIINHIFAIDNRGSDDPSTVEAIEELTAQLEGKRPYNVIVDWQREGANKDVYVQRAQYPIGCAVLVFSAVHDLEENTTGITDFIDNFLIHQGRYPLAVITHVDVADIYLVNKLCTILHTFGVSDIFKVVNLTNEQPKLDEDSQLNFLNLLNKCLTDGDETLIFKYNECKWRELMRRHEMMISECARTGAQQHELRDSFAALKRERMAALKRERVEFLERDRSEALKLERMAALERERMAALERERMVALERERMAVLERKRSEAQGREREAALKDTIMEMKRDMQIMVTAERERQASREDSKQGTKMPFNPEGETSQSSPPSRTSSIGHLRVASSPQTLQTSHRSTSETLCNISGAQKDFDVKLNTVARKFARRDEIDNLGKALGFEPEDIQRYVDTNMKNSEVSYMGTLSMLRKWRKKQTKATECGALKQALEEADQNHLADELFGTS